jgi:predicted nucleic acid-binding protein
MSADDFFDSNVLLYLLSSDVAKASITSELLSRGGVISVQVLNELANVASKKFHASFAKIHDVLSGIREICVVKSLDIETHDLGLDIAERYKFSIYDSMLLAAAQKANCTTFFTEDIQHGQKIGGLTVRNPFRP